MCRSRQPSEHWQSCPSMHRPCKAQHWQTFHLCLVSKSYSPGFSSRHQTQVQQMQSNPTNVANLVKACIHLARQACLVCLVPISFCVPCNDFNYFASVPQTPQTALLLFAILHCLQLSFLSLTLPRLCVHIGKCQLLYSRYTVHALSHPCLPMQRQTADEEQDKRPAHASRQPPCGAYGSKQVAGVLDV